MSDKKTFHEPAPGRPDHSGPRNPGSYLRELLSREQVRALMELLKDKDAETLAVQKELCAIGSPSNHEEDRAERYYSLMSGIGLDEVRMDEVHNVIGLLRGTGCSTARNAPEGTGSDPSGRNVSEGSDSDPSARNAGGGHVQQQRKQKHGRHRSQGERPSRHLRNEAPQQAEGYRSSAHMHRAAQGRHDAGDPLGGPELLPTGPHGLRQCRRRRAGGKRRQKQSARTTKVPCRIDPADKPQRQDHHKSHHQQASRVRPGHIDAG